LRSTIPLRTIRSSATSSRRFAIGGTSVSTIACSLLVYRPSLFEDAAATASRWRAYCRAAGIGELFLVSTHAFDNRSPHDFS
jgi:hypothetical protein